MCVLWYGVVTVVWCGAAWCRVVSCGVVRCGIDMAWYGMTWSFNKITMIDKGEDGKKLSQRQFQIKF